MAEYSRLATGSFTSTGAAKAIYLPFAPTSVKVWNYSSFATPAQNGVPEGYWNSGMGQGYAVINAFNATPVLTTDIISTNGISTFSAGLSFQYGAQIAISGITKASAAVVTTGSAHGYSTGDVVMFQGLYQSSTTGMPQICGMPFVITVTGTTTFTIPWNTNQSNYTALSGSPSGAYVKKVLYPFLYAPGVSFITAITTGSTTTIDTTAPHNLVVGQEVAFHIPSSWGTIQLNENNNTIIPSSPVYGYVVSVTDSNTVVVNINSSSYTAFDSNQTVAAVKAGLSFPQMCAVGDVNTGGVAISAGSPLYPSPVVNSVSTINGPAIQGSFVNNTRQGFIIGAGVGATLTSAALIGANGNTLFWEAMIPDYS
jgi:hypothetical protein